MQSINQFLLTFKQDTVLVGIGDMKVSRDPQTVLVTYALGTCIGLTLYDPVVRVGGMIHCKLPYAPENSREENMKPALYVDQGVPALIEALLKLGAEKERLIAKIAGASVQEDGRDIFRIGERNYRVMRDALHFYQLRLKGRECGGNIPRTLYLFLSDGKTMIRSASHLRNL